MVALSLDFVKLRGDFVKLGGKKAGDALAVGEDEARGMSGQYDGDKLEAAQKAARDTADGFATQMPEQAMATYADVETNKPEAEQGLRDLATSTRTNVDLIYQNIKKTLDSIKSSSIQAADAARSAAVAEIDQARASTNAGLAAQSASQIAAIHQQASAARTQLTQSGAAGRAATAELAAQSASGLEGGAAGIVHGAAQIEAPNLEDVARTVQKSTADLEGGADGLNRSLAQSATDASEGLAGQAAGVGDGMASLARTAQAQATQAGAGAKQQISVIAQGAIKSFGQLAEGSKATFDKTSADAKTAFQGQIDQLKQAYDTAATDRATSFTTTLSDCQSKLDGTVPARGGGAGGAGSGKKAEGGDSSGGGPTTEVPAIQDAAKKAADAVKPWWQKALAVVVAVVVSIAVVIIVTALIATTGPVGMILVGAAAGALSTVLGTMASNLVLGNNIMKDVTWKSVAIGALGGALCAGATAGMGAAAKAVAGSTRIAGSAGTAARAVGVTAKALDSSNGVVGGFRAGAIRYGANLVVNFGGSELATFAVEGKLDLSLQTLLLTVGMAKLPGKLEAFQAKIQTKIQSKIPVGIQIKKTTIGNPAKVRGAGEGGAPSASAAPGAAHDPAAPHVDGPSAPEVGKPAQGPRRTGSEATPAAGAHDPGTAPRTGASDPTPAAGHEPVKPGGGKTNEAAPGNKPAAPGGSDRALGEPGHETPAHDSAPSEHGVDAPTTGKSGEPAAKPGDTGAKPGEAKPGEAKPGDTGAAPTEAKSGETTPGETTPGEATPGENADGPAAQPGEEAAPGGQTGESSARSDAQEAHDQARDQELDKDGYREGTRAKADETAAKVERGEKPSKDGLRDTEGNVRGREELEHMLHDPELPAKERARIEKLLGDELHGKSAPTGRLDHDIEQARAKAEAEAQRNKRGDENDPERAPDQRPKRDGVGGVDRGRPGHTEVRPEPPARRGALRRALDRANQGRQRVVDTTKHYASKAGELRQIDRRALPATKLRAGIMLSTKARTVRPIKLSDLDVIHPITRDAALAKLETRAAKLREATDRVRAQGGLDEQLLNELIPSNDLIRVVKYRDRYMVFDGNGRLEAIRRAFPDMQHLEITVLEFETRVDLSKLIDKARHSALPPVESDVAPGHAPHAPTPPTERLPGVHEPERGGRPAPPRDEPGPVRDEPERAPGARDDEATPRARDDEPPRTPHEEPERAPEEAPARTEEASEDGDVPVDVDRDVGPPEPSGGKGPEGGDHPHPADMGSRDGIQGGEAAHDVPGGIAEPAQIESFVAEVKSQLFDRWSEMTPEDRANAAADIVNRRLAESGVPATEVHPVKELPATANGRFNRTKWAIEMPLERFAAAKLDPAAAKQLASTLAHEANHAEQFFLGARAAAESYRATPNRPARPDAFVELMAGRPRSMDPGAARAAFETPRLTPGELEAANAMYNDMLGKTGVDARAKIYNEMKAANAEYAEANAAWKANKNPETDAAKKAAAQRAVAAHRAYEQLPEEIAAHKVGGKVKDEVDRTSGTQEPGASTGKPGSEEPRTRGEDLGDDDLPHPADIELGGQPLHDQIDYDQTIRDAVNALPEHLRPSETELAARHDDLVKTLEEWVRSGKPSVETAQRGETAHDRIYADLEDLGRALVGTVRSSGNLARERALAKQTAQSASVRDGVANVMRKIHDKLAADFSSNGPFRELAERMRTDVESLRSRYMFWYAGRDVFGELEHPSPGDLDSNIALIHDLEDYFRYENPFDQKLYGDYTPDQRIGTVGEHPDDPASPTTDQPFGDYRHNSTSVKENNPWIQTARAHDAPVWAGPSVTTGRMLTFAKAAGATPEELTGLAWGLWSFWNTSYNTGRSGIHTFHEVMDIARAFGVDYTPFQYPDHPPGTEEP